MVIDGQLTEDGRLIVPARAACEALGLPGDFIPPAAWKFADGSIQHGRMIDGQLYVAARDLVDRTGRTSAWLPAEKRLIVG